MQPNSGTSRVVDLAERHSQDLDVFLMWGKRSGRLWVRVTHRASGRTARYRGGAVECAGHLNHPFAYAGRPVMQMNDKPILICYDGSSGWPPERSRRPRRCSARAGRSSSTSLRR